MQELEAQLLDGSLQAPLCQDEAEVPEGQIENERASEIATPAAARKSSSLDVGLTSLLISFFNSCQRFLIGFRSGDSGGLVHQLMPSW